MCVDITAIMDRVPTAHPHLQVFYVPFLRVETVHEMLMFCMDVTYNTGKWVGSLLRTHTLGKLKV